MQNPLETGSVNDISKVTKQNHYFYVMKEN